MEEYQAIACLKKGDLSSLDELVRLYQTQAIHAAYLIVLDYPLAEDIVQESFLHAFDKIHQFDESRPFGPWFLRSVVNAALKTTRHTRKFSPLEASEKEAQVERVLQWAEPVSEIEKLVENDEIRQEVWQAIRQLPAQQRAVIVMRYYLELSEAEMVAKLDHPASTIKWWLREARQQIRTWFSEEKNQKEQGGSARK